MRSFRGPTKTFPPPQQQQQQQQLGPLLDLTAIAAGKKQTMGKRTAFFLFLLFVAWPALVFVVLLRRQKQNLETIIGSAEGRREHEPSKKKKVACCKTKTPSKKA